ncbi:MAG: hypothetical protein AAB526_00380 [Patescibacteria group bacterium]
MKIKYSPKFKKSICGFSKEIREKFYKQISFLLYNIQHPSLRAKKYNESKDIWQARVNQSVRFYFLIKNNVYILLDIKKHPK